MSLNEDMVAEKPRDGVDCRQSTAASESILLSEYGMLLRTVEPLRIINRTLIIGISLLLSLFSPFSLSKQLLLQIVAAFTCGFWFLQEFVIGRKLGRLGELIAATNAYAVNAAARPTPRPVVVPPPKKELHTGQMPMATPNAGSQDRDLEGISFEESWTNSYVTWRQEAWKIRKLLTLQRLEPIIWFLLILAVEVYRYAATR